MLHFVCENAVVLTIAGLLTATIVRAAEPLLWIARLLGF